MGNIDGKTTKHDEETLQDISNQCQMGFGELKTEYEQWMAKYPKGTIEEREFLTILTKILPNYSEEDLKKVSNHVFRVYDDDSNHEISFKDKHDSLMFLYFYFPIKFLVFSNIGKFLGQLKIVNVKIVSSGVGVHVGLQHPGLWGHR